MGMSVMREERSVLEKDSLPAASAGRGAFLMAGYCGRSAIQHSSSHALGPVRMVPYRCGSNTVVLGLWCWSRCGRSLDVLEGVIGRIAVGI